ncbi:hypothetical protein [Actinoplanes sp. NPDC026619]|uniref:deazapurine DNA modification protein DpdA family protein n=1 Tax=Actinoplanes sp. NPDC026619 TaxID=3155798 RepID=UPI003407858D
MEVFYLGTHRPAWLSDCPVPLFVSDTTLRERRRLPRAVCRWALDSGGFSQLTRSGSWADGPTPRQYATRIRRYADEIGGLDWASAQDWMCEPPMLAHTGLDIRRHQYLTVINYLELTTIDPGLPIVPAVQGWRPGDYLDCVELYARYGVDLRTLPLVAVGSLCRRQGTAEAETIVDRLHRHGLRRLHTYGVKTLGLARFADRITSSDSLAWSRTARHQPPLPGCTHRGHCGNCRRFALRWRTALLRRTPLSGAPRPAPPPD